MPKYCTISAIAAATALAATFVITVVTADVDPNPTTAAQSATPQNACGQPATPIAQIQGTTAISPLRNQNVTLEAVTTASFLGEHQLNGFFVLEEPKQQDNNPKSSEGLFIYAPHLTIIPLHHRLRITGQVQEYKGTTELHKISALQDCGPFKLDAYQAPLLPLPYKATKKLEALEHMPIRWPASGVVVTNLARYGKEGMIAVAPTPLIRPTQTQVPGTAAYQLFKKQQRDQLWIDDASFVSHPQNLSYPAPGFRLDRRLRVGDQLHSPTDTAHIYHAVLFHNRSQYRILPTVSLVHQPATRPTTLIPKKDTAQLRIASFNVHNYFNHQNSNDRNQIQNRNPEFKHVRGAQSRTELKRQEQKLISALNALNADIIGIMEIENNGYNAQSAIAQLSLALASASGRDYRFIKPQTPRLGTNEISVAMLYNAQRLKLLGTARTLNTTAFEQHNRAPLMQRFQDLKSGLELGVAVNHFKSKNCRKAIGPNQDQKDGQSCWNAVRVQAAQALIQAVPNNEAWLLLGDFNAYLQEDPIRLLHQAGFASLLNVEQATYLYQGQAGTLDYALATASLAKHLAQAQVWPINTPEAALLDYHNPQPIKNGQPDFFTPDPYRSSDHDPVIVDFD